METAKNKESYKFYTENIVTTGDICVAIDSFETNDNPNDKKRRIHKKIKSGGIQNELRIEKYNLDKKIPRTDKEIDDLALKDLFEKDEKLNEIISEAKEVYMEHKKSINIVPKTSKKDFSISR